MIRVTIKDPGLFISIPKYGSFRTPAVLNIPEGFITFVEALLRKAGVSNYTIGKAKQDTITIKEPQIITIDITPRVENIDDVRSKLNSIEDLLQLLLKKKSVSVLTDEPVEKLIRKKQKEEEKEDIFIPRINSEFILKGDSSKKSQDESGEINSQVDALLKTRNKNNKIN